MLLVHLLGGGLARSLDRPQVEFAEPLGVGQGVNFDDPAPADRETHHREQLTVAQDNRPRSTGMQGRLGDICAALGEDELVAVAGFLRSAVEAGRGATEELASG